MAEIRRCTMGEIEAAPNITHVLAEYAREAGMQEIGDPSPQWDTYSRMEAAGVLHPIGTFDGPRLEGFILPVVVTLPHYGVLVATVESFFVPRAARKTGIGLALLRAAEALAKDLGAKALLLSAPTGSTLARVMPHQPYRHSNDVFVRAL